VLPGPILLQIIGGGLFDAEPIVLQRFLLVSDELDPVLFFADGNAIGFCQYTFTVDILLARTEERKKVGRQQTNCALALGVILSSELMCSLVLKVGCSLWAFVSTNNPAEI
jgi:hypothetical protein